MLITSTKYFNIHVILHNTPNTAVYRGDDITKIKIKIIIKTYLTKLAIN